MLVNIGIKAYMVLKLLRIPKMKTYIEMLANVGIKTCYIDKKTCQNLTNKTYKCW